MEIDRTVGEFVLDDKDISLLGEPAFSEREPFTQAPNLFNRAQQRAALNNSRDMAEYPAGANRDRVRAEQALTNLRLVELMAGFEQFLPRKASIGDQVEASLDAWTRQFGYDS